MNAGVVIAIVVVVLIIIAAAAWFAMRKRRTEDLKEHFGSEYDRTVQDAGNPREAESILVERRKRVESLDTRPLTADEQQRFTDSWQDVQARFVDDPSQAIGDADSLIADVMRTRGYPTDMFEQRTDVISVEHPDVVNNYRTAHQIAERNQQGDATTEDLRSAMLQYRSLFSELVTASQTEEAKT